MSSTEQGGGLTLVGITLPKKTTNENYQSTIDIGAFWETFMKENVASKIPGRTGDDIYAVYYDYEGDHTKPFRYFIGVPVGNDTTVPAGMIKLDIPTGRYQHFIAKGKMPDCLIDTWGQIWSADIRRSYTADYEVYGVRSIDAENAEVDIYIAI
nr:GyrI-like small molecule binding domain protein [uncultured bacterium]